jgi:aqualysin 1
MQHRNLWLVALSLALVLSFAGPAAAAPQSPAAPLVAADAAHVIPGRYIVVMKTQTSSDVVDHAVGLARAVEVANANAVTVHYRYTDALNGFAATLSPKALDALRHNPNVEYVEADQTVTIDTTQTGATWGIDRIDQRNLPLNGSFNYSATGAGVKAYIIDTGIRIAHSQFGGRASVGTDKVGDGQNGNDCNGHGTHVAGTVGGATYGVAKKVSLIAVRVLNCSGSGSNSGVIAGIDWVTSNHQAGQPAVANMSLGGSASSTLDSAVGRAIADGVTFAIAAGNSNASACSYSPARVAAAITVGATTNTDTRASYSNYGSCVDIFAPGSSITSAWNTSNTATNTISGTSMATPHVTGVAALYLQSHTTASPATVAAALIANADGGVVKSAGAGSPNKLLYTNY